jgi:hypothetical protein
MTAAEAATQSPRKSGGLLGLIEDALALPGELANTVGSTVADAVTSIGRNIHADRLLDQIAPNGAVPGQRQHVKDMLKVGVSDEDIKNYYAQMLSSPPLDTLSKPTMLMVSDGGIEMRQDRALAQEIARRTGRHPDDVYRELRGLPSLGSREMSETHSSIRAAARSFRPDIGTLEWTTSDALDYAVGLKDIWKFKDQWVSGYRHTFIAAAARYDIPPELVAGVAYNEVGGDPSWIDQPAYWIRGNTTSFGNMSMQVRTASATLGYSNPSRYQELMIISSLLDPEESIFIAAKHLSDLRNIDFRGVNAINLTRNQFEIVATRYNTGGGLSLQSVRGNLDYGYDITKRYNHISILLSD